jgi:hypothetical protein
VACAFASTMTIANFFDGYTRAQSYQFPDPSGYGLDWALSANGLIPIAALITWPWIVFAALQVFQISMHQARVRSIHSLRCVLYSYDLTIAMAVVAVAAISLIGRFVPTLTWLIGPLPVYAYFAIVLATLYRMWIAYRRYLRFDHAFLTVLAANIIAVLVLFILVLFVGRLLVWAS